VGFNMGSGTGRVALAKWQLASLIGVALLATGAAGTMVWRMAMVEPKQTTPQMTADEMRLLAKADEERARKQREGKKLKQSELGAGYQVDPEGNLTGPSENSDLPTNQSLDEVGAGVGRQEIAKGIRGKRKGSGGDGGDGTEEERYLESGGVGARDEERGSEKIQRTELEKPMLGYTTVKTAKWATRLAGVGEGGEAGRSADASKGLQEGGLDHAIDASEKKLASLREIPAAVGAVAGLTSPGAGPSKSGSELMPAEEQPQPFTAGSVGDMRIGGIVGKDQVVRQGKFLDCVLVNEVRADLMDSPVIGMVSRDFISLDGQYVLVPAGSKLIGSAGRVQNLQQARVYMRFDRVIFPDQRSAYFPVRRLPAVDGPGAVGIEGDVDRHFLLMFGSAVMLGMLDGLAAAVEGANNAATPTARELIMARTSMNMSQVVGGILARYGNVVPTITLEAGSKMKVFFAEDVRMSPYMRAGELSWVRHGR